MHDPRRADSKGDPQQAAPGCLTTEDCFAHLEGRSAGRPPAEIEAHIDACARCRLVLVEAARAVVDSSAKSDQGGTRILSAGSLEIGERLGDRFEILRFVARGGMGEVYEALDTVLGERVALKTLVVTALDQEDAAQRLLSEVRLARRVTHTNVCRILELGLHRRPGAGATVVPFLTMEFLVGETLSARLARTGPLAAAEIQPIVGALCAGLGAVHRAGIVHRDFKTDNVFLVKEGPRSERPVVMDFGLARALEIPGRLSSARLLVGTAAYMAPEQVEGRPPTPAFDIYALGVILFELLTGRLPFSGETAMAAAFSRLQREAPAPSSLSPGVPAGWDAVVARCLARDPAQRFARVEDVAAALAEKAPVGAGARPKSRTLVLGGAVVATVLGAGLWASSLAPKAAPGTGATPAEPTGAPATPTAPPRPGPETPAAPAPAAPSPAAPAAASPREGLDKELLRRDPARSWGRRQPQDSRPTPSSAATRTAAANVTRSSGAAPAGAPTPDRPDPLAPAPRDRAEHPDDVVDPFAP